MCCFRPSEEQILQFEQQRRQSKAVEDLEAAIENAELPEVGDALSKSTPGVQREIERKKRTNG